VDHAHEQIADPGTVLRFEKERILTVQDRPFDDLFTMPSLFSLFIEILGRFNWHRCFRHGQLGWSWSGSAVRMSGQIPESRQVFVVSPIDSSAAKPLRLYPTSTTPGSQGAWLDAEFVGKFLGSPEWPDDLWPSTNHSFSSQYEHQSVDA
jgi:hypothetical protein